MSKCNTPVDTSRFLYLIRCNHTDHYLQEHISLQVDFSQNVLHGMCCQCVMIILGGKV